MNLDTRSWLARLATVALLACAMTAQAQAPAQTPAAAQSQALNPRWHGSWQSGPERLVITTDAIRTGERNCRWVSVRPKASPKGCVAFYDRGIPKSYLTGMFEQAERAITRQAQDRQNPLDAASRKQLLDDLARHRRVLGEVSDDVFRSLVMESPANEGDCSSFHFIDRDVVYEATTCPYPEANSLRAYRKLP